MQETRRNSAFCDARVKGGEGGVRIGGLLSYIGHQSDTQDFFRLVQEKKWTELCLSLCWQLEIIVCR